MLNMKHQGLKAYSLDAFILMPITVGVEVASRGSTQASLSMHPPAIVFYHVKIPEDITLTNF